MIAKQARHGTGATDPAATTAATAMAAAAAAGGGIGRVPAARHTAGWQGTHSEIDHSRVYTLAQLLLVKHRTTLYI